jgi:hypothetical protein
MGYISVMTNLGVVIFTDPGKFFDLSSTQDKIIAFVIIEVRLARQLTCLLTCVCAYQFVCLQVPLDLLRCGDPIRCLCFRGTSTPSISPSLQWTA